MSLELLAKEPNACAFRSGRWFASLTLGTLIALQIGTASASGIGAAPATVDRTSIASVKTTDSSPRSGRVDAQRPVVVAQAATPAATDAPAASVAATQDNGGIPWWVWALLALLVVAIVLWLLSRRKAAPGSTARGRKDEPIIKTRK